MRFVPGGDSFPSPCLFCGHIRNGEGICQCPPDCPACLAGDPLMVSCCGRAVQVEVRIAPIGAEADINHPRALLAGWREEANRTNYYRLAAEADSRPADAAVFSAVSNAMRRCADELEDRLRWSGLL